MTVNVHDATTGSASGSGPVDSAETVPDEVEFSLVRGGPLYRILRKMGVVRGDDFDAARQSLVFVALTWAPMMVLALAQRLLEGRWDPFVRDFSVHARLLIAVPLLFLGDDALHLFTSHSVDRFAGGRFADDPRAVKRVIESARRHRDAITPEIVMAALAVVAGQVLFWRHSPSAGLVGSSGGGENTHPPLTFWYAFIALPLTQLVFLRWLWRWFIWSRLVWQFSRLRGALAPLHPDRKGGIEFFAEAATGFAGGIAAFSVVQSGAWFSKALFGGVPASTFLGPFWVLLVTALLFTHGPLLVWSRRLWRMRQDGALKFGHFSNEYVRLFDRKWLGSDHHRGEEPLGSPDIQSLADLSNSYAIVREVRIVLFSRHTLLTVAVAVTAPMIPVLLTQIPLAELVRRLSSVALGRLSG